jgi:hypothetical protein
MLLHPRDNLSSPRRISRSSRLARDSANWGRWRRKRLLITSKIGSKGVMVRLMVHKR